MVPSTGSALYLSFSSCTACMRRTVLGYSQVVSTALCARNSCRNSGLERNAPRTELCDLDLALDQQPGKAGTNLETPGYGLQAVRNCCVMNSTLEAAEDCYPSRNRCVPQLVNPAVFLGREPALLLRIPGFQSRHLRRGEPSGLHHLRDMIRQRRFVHVNSSGPQEKRTHRHTAQKIQRDSRLRRFDHVTEKCPNYGVKPKN